MFLRQAALRIYFRSFALPLLAGLVTVSASASSLVLVGPETQTHSTCRVQVTEASPEHLEILFSVQDQSGDVITLEVVNLAREGALNNMMVFVASEDREYFESDDDLFASETQMRLEMKSTDDATPPAQMEDPQGVWSFQRLKVMAKLSGTVSPTSTFENLIYNCPHLTQNPSW